MENISRKVLDSEHVDGVKKVRSIIHCFNLIHYIRTIHCIYLIQCINIIHYINLIHCLNLIHCIHCAMCSAQCTLHSIMLHYMHCTMHIILFNSGANAI